MPEPDLLVWDPEVAGTWVTGESVRLVVEVAALSEARDLGEKRELYARHGVPEYWVAIESARRFERFADPSGGNYRRHDSFSFDTECESLTLMSLSVPGGTISV